MEPLPEDTDDGTDPVPEDVPRAELADEEDTAGGNGFAAFTDPGSITVAAIETAWRDVQARHPEVPDVVVVTAGGEPRIVRRGGEEHVQVLWGQFRSHYWDTADGPRHELLISGEALSKGPEHVLQTVLHEAVHAVNYAKGIKDTASRGQRHNKRFVAMARELGLEWPKGKPPHPTWGFTAVEITDETLADYAETLGMLDRGRAAWRTLAVPTANGNETGTTEDGTPEEGDGKPKRKKSRNTAPKGICACEGKFIKASRRLLNSGTVMCTDCGEPYRLEEPDEDE